MEPEKPEEVLEPEKPEEVLEPEKPEEVLKPEKPTGVERDTPGAPPEKEKKRHSIEVQKHIGSGDNGEDGLSSKFVNKMFQKYVVAKQR